MPFERQRFIHAANVRLDVPVSVHFSEQLTDSLRHALEDATLASFDSVIDNCLNKKVDFLLLSGNVFLEADRSLRARLKLLSGFNRLKEREIPVFVLPGDADPPEAWRSIPEMPDNVAVCFSSNPEPELLIRDNETITAVSASMWYGERDSFGIRVIGRSKDGVDPFRVGIVSRAKYDESRRMAALTASTDDSFLGVPSEDDKTRNDDASANVAATTDEAETRAEYEAAFREYIEQLMVEGHLNYVAYMGELERLTLSLANGKVHCPGTTQPRNQLEADCGTCSLVEVDEDGAAVIQELNTSAVDWKDIDLYVESDATLNSSLEVMKALLHEETRNESDRIWAVRWTVRGPLPVLHDFIEDDLELAVAVELEELDFDGQHIRLVHEVRTLPDPWEVPDKASQAQEYADLITEDAIVSRRRLMSIVKREKNLTEGWRHRLESLVAGVDRERVLARMRVDGAHWFVNDIHSLVPDLDDFDVDILQDEAVEEMGLTGDEDEETAVSTVLDEEAKSTDDEKSVQESAREAAVKRFSKPATEATDTEPSDEESKEKNTDKKSENDTEEDTES